MVTQSTEKGKAEVLRKEAEQLLKNYKDTIQKKSADILSKSGGDLVGMSGKDIEKLMFEFQIHQIELELQNEELKSAHQELSASHDEFSQIYNLSPVAYLTLNEQGIIKKANVAAIRLLSASNETLINKKLGTFIHPSDQDNYYLFMQQLVSEKNNQILNAKLLIQNSDSKPSEYQGIRSYACSQSLCRQNDPFIYVELRGSINDNFKNDIQIYLAIQDITEYKHTQETISCLNEKLEQKLAEQTSQLIESNQDLTRNIEELKHSKHQLWEREAKLNAIFNASIEGIVTIDASGIICSINSAVTTIFGYSEEELLGCSYYKLISPSQSKKQGHDVKSYLKTKMPNVRGLIREVDGLCKDGSIVPLDISLVEFSIEGGNYFTGILRDVSLRKLQEQKEKEHLEELALATRLCLIGEMGSGIAHEVNQPLTAITNYTQACLRFIGAENPDLNQLGEILFKVHQQALKAGQIIHRMKDFVSSRKIHRTETNINTLIEDAVSLCATDFKQNNIKVKLDLAKNIPDVTIDDIQIEQVLLNLIRNSIDALKDLPPTKPRKIIIQTYMKNLDQISCRVRDSGSGIDEALKEKIWSPFFTTKPTGMGMGLSISRSIIEAHQGIFNFNSSPEEGTTFYVTLPIKRKIK